MDLKLLRLDVDGLNDGELESLAKNEYAKTYITSGKIGIIQAHDGQEVWFWFDRYEHAFQKANDKYGYGVRKDQYCPNRIARLKWIGPVIAGQVPGTSCYEIPGIPGQQRLYIVGPESYVVWLEKRASGGWKFSSAYIADRSKMREYSGEGKKVWSKK